MTRKSGKSIIACAGLAVVAASAASLAFANIASPQDDPAGAALQHGSEYGMTGAVEGRGLLGDARGPVCYDKGAVVAYFDGDRARIGGEVVTLEAGFDQDFADAWRTETRMRPVAVSGVFAHIFPTASGSSMVDVVELGGEGCAISRTLLTEEEWNQILVRAAGVAV